MKYTLFIYTLLAAFIGNAQIVVYSEDFQNGLPLNYTIVNNDGLTPAPSVSEFTDAWILLDDPTNPGDSIMGSTSFFDPAGTSDRWLITPQVSLGAFGNILYWEARSHDPSFPDDYMILISTTDMQISSFTDTLFSYGGEIDTWIERSVNVSDSGYNNVNVHFAFVNKTEDGFKLYIDDIRVESEDPVGIEEMNLNSISIYPNPAMESIYVGEIMEGDIVELYNSSGQFILSSTQCKISVEDLDAGLYLVSVKGAKHYKTSRFIKL